MTTRFGNGTLMMPLMDRVFQWTDTLTLGSLGTTISNSNENNKRASRAEGHCCCCLSLPWTMRKQSANGEGEQATLQNNKNDVAFCKTSNKESAETLTAALANKQAILGGGS